MRRDHPFFGRRCAHLLILPLLIIAGCSSASAVQADLKPGMRHEDVMQVLGMPDKTADFVMPNGPFFGPQEQLSDLVPAGSTVEEWQYIVQDEVIYAWFRGDSMEPRDAWKLIASAIVPRDAIY